MNLGELKIDLAYSQYRADKIPTQSNKRAVETAKRAVQAKERELFCDVKRP